MSIKEERVNVSSGYGANTKRPFVAVLLWEGAEAAEGDAFVVEWFTEKAGLELAQAAALLNDFRQSRERHREGERL